MIMMMLALLIVGSYITFAGMTARLVYEHTHSSDHPGTVFGGLLWPITIAFFLGWSLPRLASRLAGALKRSPKLVYPKCVCNGGDEPCPKAPKTGVHR